MFFHQRFVSGLAAASYVIGDELSGECAVVDPLRDVDEYLRIAERQELRITHVLETHVHADFVSGAAELKARLGGQARIHCSGMGGEEWTPRYADDVVRDGDWFELGRLRFQAIHTPGHTPEHVAWAVYDLDRSSDTPWFLLSGDFVFVGSVGRPDLLGEAASDRLARDLYRSLFEVASRFPDFTEIFPAHGAGSLCGKGLGSRRSSTLGYERRFSPPLRKKDEETWIRDLMEGMPEAPPYFARMKDMNRRGPRVLGDPPPGRRPVALEEFSRRREEGAIVLDVRPGDAFAAGHVPGSIHIGLDPVLPGWAGWVLPYDRPILLVAASEPEAIEASTYLLAVGFDDLVGFLEGGYGSWLRAGLEASTLGAISAEELEESEDLFVLDVRSDAEWRDGHLDGALHVQLGEVEARREHVPRGRDVAVICGSGYRSSIACSLLARYGFRNLRNVQGGMGAWRSTRLAAVR